MFPRYFTTNERTGLHNIVEAMRKSVTNLEYKFALYIVTRNDQVNMNNFNIIFA